MTAWRAKSTSRRGPFECVFAPLRDPNMFDAVTVDPVLSTICWPNGADLDALYAT